MTSDDPRHLNVGSVNLLLELLEAPEPVLSGAVIADFHLEAGAALAAAGLLRPCGYVEAAPSPADHDDIPVSLVWCPVHQALGVVDPITGWVEVPHDRLLRHRLAVDVALAAMASPLGLQRGWQPQELVPDLAWDLGEVRIGRAKQRTPMWFARRLADPNVWHRLREAARRRPPTARRVVLTSTPTGHLPKHDLERHVIVALRDMLPSTGLMLDERVLAAALGMAPIPDPSTPLALSPDGRMLSIQGGEPIRFRSASQIAVIRRLVDGYQRGLSYRATELLKPVHSGAATLQHFFGQAKWAQLSSHLKSSGGLWSFKP